MAYKLITTNGYDIFEIDNHLFMFDTGRQTVIFNPAISQIIINGQSFRGARAYLNPEEMVASFGAVVEGFIGIDIIHHFGAIEIDRINQTVSFGPSNKPHLHEVPLRMGGYMTTVNGVTCPYSFLDTGAPIVGVRDINILRRGTLVNAHHIENTNDGPRETELYKGTIIFQGVEVETELFYLKDGFHWNKQDTIYFGLNNLAKEFYVIDVAHNVLYFN